MEWPLSGLRVADLSAGIAGEDGALFQREKSGSA
jgi:hypothetical protein